MPPMTRNIFIVVYSHNTFLHYRFCKRSFYHISTNDFFRIHLYLSRMSIYILTSLIEYFYFENRTDSSTLI